MTIKIRRNLIARLILYLASYLVEEKIQYTKLLRVK